MRFKTLWKSIASFMLALFASLTLSSLALAQTVVTNIPLKNLGGVDTFLRSSAKTTSFNSNPYMIVGGWGDLYLGVIRWDISSIAPLANGEKVELVLCNVGLVSGPTSTQVTISVIAYSWVDTIFWNQGVAYYTSSRTQNVDPYGYCTAIDVSDYHTLWKGGLGNYGLLIQPVNSWNNFDYFASTEHPDTTKRPYLRVTRVAQVVVDPYRFLNFPLKVTGFTDWKTAPITSVMDHAKYSLKPTQPGYVDSNATTMAFNGESAVNYNGSYITNWCPNRASNLAYLDHPIGGKIPYKGATDGTGCAGTKTMAYNGHNGYDYPVGNGTPVYAAADGVVTTNQCDTIDGACPSSTMGRVILRHTIDVGGGVKKIYYTWYMHMSKAVTDDGKSYKVGSTIVAGKQLGLSGATGAGSAYHLHFEMRVGGDGTANDYGANVDPYGWYGNGDDPLSVTTGYQTYYQNAGHTNRLLWK